MKLVCMIFGNFLRKWISSLLPSPNIDTKETSYGSTSRDLSPSNQVTSIPESQCSCWISNQIDYSNSSTLSKAKLCPKRHWFCQQFSISCSQFILGNKWKYSSDWTDGLLYHTTSFPIGNLKQNHQKRMSKMLRHDTKRSCLVHVILFSTYLLFCN